jgi:hypothetical protein
MAGKPGAEVVADASLTGQANASITVPAGMPSWITPELIADTIETWQPYSASTLTPDDAVEILQNVGHLADVLESIK